MSERNFEQIIEEMIEIAIDKIDKGLPCGFKKKNNQGQDYCSIPNQHYCSISMTEAIYERVKSVCPFIGEQRTVNVATDFSQEIPEDINNKSKKRIAGSNALMKAIFENLPEENKDQFEKKFGNPNINVRVTEQYLCSYEVED
jgi:hypothetical protein